jgi:hypothetical protein
MGCGCCCVGVQPGGEGCRWIGVGFEGVPFKAEAYVAPSLSARAQGLSWTWVVSIDRCRTGAGCVGAL